MKEPFFILYDARSGSTLLANELCKRYNCLIIPETNFIVRLIRKFGNAHHDILYAELLQEACKDPKFSDLAINLELFQRNDKKGLRSFVESVVLNHMENLEEDLGGADMIWGVKKGSYINYAEKLLLIWPKAKMLLLYRDGRAVFYSKKRNITSEGNTFETNVVSAAFMWKSTTKKLKQLSRRYPDQTFDVFYEQFTASHEKHLRTIQKFLGLDGKEKKCENGYKVTSRYGKSLHDNVEKKIAPNARWKYALSAREVFIYELIAKKEMLSLGYPLKRYKKHSFFGALIMPMALFYLIVKYSRNLKNWSENWKRNGFIRR